MRSCSQLGLTRPDLTDRTQPWCPMGPEVAGAPSTRALRLARRDPQWQKARPGRMAPAAGRDGALRTMGVEVRAKDGQAVTIMANDATPGHQRRWRHHRDPEEWAEGLPRWRHRHAADSPGTDLNTYLGERQ